MKFTLFSRTEPVAYHNCSLMLKTKSIMNLEFEELFDDIEIMVQSFPHIEDEHNDTFDFESSPAWQLIKEKKWNKITHKELLKNAMILSGQLKRKLSRNQKRSKKLLIKWFNDHLSEIIKLCSNVEKAYETDTESE